MVHEDNSHACAGRKSGDERGSSFSVGVYYQRVIEFASRNVTWPTLTRFSEAPPIISQKGDHYVEFPNTSSSCIFEWFSCLPSTRPLIPSSPQLPKREMNQETQLLLLGFHFTLCGWHHLAWPITIYVVYCIDRR